MSQDALLNQNLLNKFNDKLIIGTHDGDFHADEALSCFMLRMLYPKSVIIRSRKPVDFEKCDILVDVGGQYDPENLKFDHHQRDFSHTMSTINSAMAGDIKLSSAGLIYAHFGKNVLEKFLKDNDPKYEDNGEDSLRKLKFMYERLYHSFIKEIDAVDNGVPQFQGEPCYYFKTDLSNRLRHLNREWNVRPEDYDDDAGFIRAQELVGLEFLETIRRTLKVIYPAREVVRKAIQNRFEIHKSGDTIYLDKYCPWKEHFFELEKEMGLKTTIKYVIFEGEDESFRIMGVPLEPASFVGRKFLPPSWRGLRDDELSKKTGIDGCIFAHHTGFIGGNRTEEGAIKMAIAALESTETDGDN